MNGTQETKTTAAERSFPGMGGEVEVQLPRGSACAMDRIAALFAEYERRLSRFREDSELTALNNSRATPFRASPVLFDAVSEAVGWACITDGIFDPTVIDVLEAVGYDRSFEDIKGSRRVESPPARGGRPAQRWRGIRFDYEQETITLPADVRIDLGGIGKGYTVDAAVAALGPGANAMVKASGDLFAAGDGPGGAGWYVGVQDPRSPEDDLLVLNLNDRGVATSGTGRRSWAGAHERYHHIIDPRAGTSAASGLAAVTVVAQTATQADILAKTALVLGIEDGVRFIERFGGAECVAVTHAGDVLTSSGMTEFYA